MLDITIHDTPHAFRLQLRGELSGAGVRELELCWGTVNSTLGARTLEVEVSELRSVDQAGKDLLTHLCRAGARFLASTPAARGLVEELKCRADVAGGPARPRVTLIGRLMSVLRSAR